MTHDIARPAARNRNLSVLALNAGSSSLKYKLLRVEHYAGAEQVLAEGAVEHAGPETAQHAAEQAIGRAGATGGVDAVGYRVVHGGPRFTSPERVTDDVLAALREVVPLAPLHLPTDIAILEAGRRLLPDAAHVAVFDTAFHATLPPVAHAYALPHNLAARHGLRRYGFHGISHRYVSETVARLRGGVPSRLVSCHLGSGASLCAIRDGRSVDTSMGMTPLEGLVMGTRSGDLDPGLLLYLETALHLTPAYVEEMLNEHSGLIGISGLSSDVRELDAAEAEGNTAAALALDLFAYRARKYVGAYAAALGGPDTIAFAGGIGERSPAMRARICADLAFLGIQLDPARNGAARGDAPARISPDGAAVEVWVIPTDEERQIAREVAGVIRNA